MAGDPRNLTNSSVVSGDVTDLQSELGKDKSEECTSPYRDTIYQKLNLSNVDLNPDDKDSISREYAKRLAMKYAYSHSLTHFTPANSSYGNLILPSLKTNEMHIAQTAHLFSAPSSAQ